MTEQPDNYWVRRQKQRIDRRQLLQRSAIAGLGTAGLAVVGCGGDDDASDNDGASTATTGGQAGQPNLNGTIRGALAAPIDFISPNTCSQGGGCGNWRGMSFAGLYETNQEYIYQPLMTKPYEANPDFTEYVFELLPEAKFWDGTQVTADDVVFSVEQSLIPETKYHLLNSLKNVSSVTAESPTTVKFKMKVPDALLVRYLPSILPRAHFAKVGDHNGFAKDPMGAGPWKMSQVQLRESVQLERNDAYWGAKPAIKSVVWSEIADNNTRASALLAGEVDFIRDVPPNIMDQIEAKDGYKTYSNPGATTLFIKYNTFTPPFDDVRVRQALYHATDINAILKNIVGKIGGPTVGFLPESVTGKDSALKTYDYNPTRAKQLLSDAGFSGGFSTDLVFPIGRYVIGDQIVQAVAQMWNAVGVKTNVQSMDYSAWTTAVTSHTLKAPTVAQYATYFLDGQLSTSGQYTGTADPKLRPPYSEYAAPAELSTLLSNMLRVDAAEERKTAWRRVNQILMEDAASIWLYEQAYTTGMIKELDYQPLKGAESADLRWSKLA